MNGRLMVAALAAAGAVLAAGCNGSKTATTGPAGVVDDLVAQARPPIPDVPMPLKFKYEDGRSRSFARPGVRMIDHVYHGPSEKFAVARFFRNQMQQSGWTRVTETQVQGIIMQDYEKQGETCRIMLSDRGLFGGTEVKVQVYPSGQPAAPAGEPKN